MRATGIVRRMDDLGRVVIPKEIRKNIGVAPGDPLEIFVTREGEVVFKKYCPIKEYEWETAQKIISHFIKGEFVLVDRYGCIQAGLFKQPAVIGEGGFEERYPIMVDGEEEGYLMVRATKSVDEEKPFAVAAKMIEELFARED